jgi:hypothetical protein
MVAADVDSREAAHEAQCATSVCLFGRRRSSLDAVEKEVLDFRIDRLTLCPNHDIAEFLGVLREM